MGKILQIRNVSAESHEFSIHGERHARTRFSSESELRAARMTRLADETSVSRLRDNWTKSQTTVSLITDSLVSVQPFPAAAAVSRACVPYSLAPRRPDVSSPLWRGRKDNTHMLARQHISMENLSRFHFNGDRSVRLINSMDESGLQAAIMRAAGISSIRSRTASPIVIVLVTYRARLSRNGRGSVYTW